MTPGSIETCCTVAWIAYGVEMLRLTGDSIVADELELSTLNQVVGYQFRDGGPCTYDTPMDGRRISAVEQVQWQRKPGSEQMICCTANGPRGLGMISDWALMRDGDGLVLNWYGPSTIAARAGETPVTLTQDTDYPRDGHVTLDRGPGGAARPARSSCASRYWSAATAVSINGSPVNGGLARMLPEPGAHVAPRRRGRVRPGPVAALLDRRARMRRQGLRVRRAAAHGAARRPGRRRAGGRPGRRADRPRRAQPPGVRAGRLAGGGVAGAGGVAGRTRRPRPGTGACSAAPGPSPPCLWSPSDLPLAPPIRQTPQDRPRGLRGRWVPAATRTGAGCPRAPGASAPFSKSNPGTNLADLKDMAQNHMTRNERIRIALIGAGKRGRNVRLPAIRMMSDRFELAAVCDMNGETARRVAAECGVPAYTRVQDLVAGERLDAAAISTPGDSHHAIGTYLAERGIHIIVETPLATTLPLCDVLIEAVDRNGVKLEVAEQYCRDPLHLAKRQIVEQGLIGDVLRVFCLFLTEGCHIVSSLRMFLGDAAATRVGSVAMNEPHPTRERQRRAQLRHRGVEPADHGVRQWSGRRDVLLERLSRAGAWPEGKDTVPDRRGPPAPSWKTTCT